MANSQKHLRKTLHFKYVYNEHVANEIANASL